MIFGFVGFDWIADGPIAGEPQSNQAAPAPLTVEWTNETSMAVTSEPGIQADD